MCFSGLLINLSSCTPEALSSKQQDINLQTGGGVIDDPAEPDEED